MKILITCLSRSWGGLEMFSLQTVIQLRKRNIETELLCFPNSSLFIEAEKQGIKTYTSPFKSYFHPVEVIKTAAFLKKNKYDIIQSGFSKDLWLLVPSLKISRLNTPLLLSKQMGSFIIKKDFLHKLIYNRLTYAFAISSVIAKNLVETTTISEKKVLLLYNGIDTNKFNPEKIDKFKFRNEFDIKKDDVLIGMMARFSPGKGHEEFLHSAQILNEKYDNLKFIVVGEPSKGEDEYAAAIKSLAQKLGVLEKTVFTGFRKDTPEVLAALDIFVFPSHAEAFGLALVEAMSMAKPSVCSGSDGVLDIAVDGVTSYLFEKQNYQDLAQKIEPLIMSPEKRNKFGNAARKRAVEMFDLEVYTNRLIEIYQEALN